ncbi:MAG: DUF2812 domain-containing protein [Anaerolineae bacterium]|nr:DUF2812 domain-containing protein [Anaerolineae bacterium]
MNPIIKQRQWFWAWQDDKQEAWLHEMSLKGLHLVNFQKGAYHFEQGEPRHYAYRLDYRDLTANQQEYEQLFADAGWKYIGSMGGWEYFRKEAAPDSMPEIYTDTESKIQKYRRLQWFFVLLLPFLWITFPNFDFEYTSLFRLATHLFHLVGFCLLAALLGCNLWKLEQRIQQLKRL